MSVIEAFPNRPLQLPGYGPRAGVRMFSIVAVLCLALVGIGLSKYPEVVSLVDDYRLHVDGTAAMQSEVGNYRYRSSRYGGSIEFDAHYTSWNGQQHTRHIEIDTFTIYEPKFKSDFLVRYDPESPEHISTNWGAEFLLSRTISLLLIFALYPISIAVAALFMRAIGRDRRKFAAIAAHPMPMEVNLVGVRADPRNRSAEIYYAGKNVSGQALSGSFTFRRGQEPFWLDAAKTKLLALAEPGGASVLLDAALARVKLTDAERTRILNARVHDSVDGPPPAALSRPAASNASPRIPPAPTASPSVAIKPAPAASSGAGSTLSIAAMTTARAYGTATLLPSGKVLIAGGGRYDQSGELSSTELYDPSGNSWSSAASLVTARLGHTAILLPSGKVLIVGGRRTGEFNAGVLVSSAELYDPASNTWSSAGALVTARTAHTASLLLSGKVLIAGGSGDLGLARTELYDPSSNIWSSAGKLAEERDGHTATVLASGKVLIAGGTGMFSSNAELYDPSSNAWASVGRLSEARLAHTATLLPSGQVLVAGGSGTSGYLASAELYDPTSNTFSTAASLNTPLQSRTACLLPSGKVLILGGRGYSGCFSSAELYDPSSDTWSSAAGLKAPRASHTATLLPSGKVLVAGGVGNTGELSSAELYDPASGA